MKQPLNNDEGYIMKSTTMSERRYELFTRLSTLPKKMALAHNADYMAELVFCELCGKGCFDLKKAAYFLDNPDFDCCRGIFGFHAPEFGAADLEVWENPTPTSEQLRRSEFNRLVRSISHASITKNNSEYLLNEIAKTLGIEKPQFCICHARHDNHGVLITEQVESEELKDYLEHGVSLLGLCPLF